MTETIVEVGNKKGLHARAAAKFVKIVAAYNADVQVVKLGAGEEPDSSPVPGGSLLGLMMLGADAGTKLKITAKGKHADAVITALKTLLANKFGEGE